LGVEMVGNVRWVGKVVVIIYKSIDYEHFDCSFSQESHPVRESQVLLVGMAEVHGTR
jgi:hypothetical protein